MGAVLRAIPLPLRIATLFLVGILVWTVLGSVASSVFVILAIVLWTFVVVTLAYEFGWLNVLAKVPGVSHALGLIANRRAAVGAATDASAAPGGSLSDDERETLYRSAQEALDRLEGVDGAREAINQRILDVAQSDPENPFGTSAPTLAALFIGPRGVGKTSAAEATARLLTGMSALQTAKIVTIRSSDLRSGQHGSPTELGRAKAHAALDGALLIDDADWLLSADPYGGPDSPGVDLGQAIYEVAAEHPQRIVVLLTIGDEAAQRLRSDAQHRSWLGRLTTRTIHFQHLDADALLTVVERTLDAMGWRLADAGASQAARRALDALSEREGEHFDNAIACRRFAETLVEVALREDPDSAQARTIDAEIVRIVDDELE